MVLKWIQSTTSHVRPETAQQAANEEYKAKEKKESKLIDVAHEVMRKDQDNLNGLVRIGLSNVKREKLRGKVRKKVWEVVSEGFGTADSDDMVEEITERMVDAAENDPYYKKMIAADDAD